jgi:nucleotide-binding universal stress UspA family protein
MASADAAARKALDAAAARLAAGDIAVKVHTRRGMVVESVLDRAKEVGADLIVVGRRGSARVTQLLLGTASSEIVRLSPISVLVVKAGDVAKEGPVLVGVDGSAPSVRALAVARATFPDAPLVSCHVAPAGAQGEDRVPADALAAARVDPKSATARTLHGDPAGELLAELSRTPYRAIVLGPRGLGPLKGLLLGSVSEKVLQLARRPVLVAR